MTRVIIAGAKGGWDRPWLRCAEAVPGLAIAGQFDKGQDLRDFIADGDVVIDFTLHEAPSRWPGSAPNTKRRWSSAPPAIRKRSSRN